VAEYGSITERELRALFPKIAIHVLKADLTSLVAKGHLQKLPLRSGMRYILKHTSDSSGEN
jgi:hypothetical protein